LVVLPGCGEEGPTVALAAGVEGVAGGAVTAVGVLAEPANSGLPLSSFIDRAKTRKNVIAASKTVRSAK
jgi:hypothetical protein